MRSLTTRNLLHNDMLIYFEFVKTNGDMMTEPQMETFDAPESQHVTPVAPNTTMHVKIVARIKEFCENPANFVDGPMNLWDISEKMKMKYGTLSKNLHLLNERRFNPNQPPENKFNDKVKVWDKKNGVWIFCMP